MQPDIRCMVKHLSPAGAGIFCVKIGCTLSKRARRAIKQGTGYFGRHIIGRKFGYLFWLTVAHIGELAHAITTLMHNGADGLGVLYTLNTVQDHFPHGHLA